jgi:hypothetical protein
MPIWPSNANAIEASAQAEAALNTEASSFDMGSSWESEPPSLGKQSEYSYHTYQW